MIQIQKQQQNTAASVIRTASECELSQYEKTKLAGIEEQAQQNRLEVVRLNGNRIPVEPGTKTINIKVGDLAFKNTVTNGDFDSNELFFIRCSLD